MTFVLDNSISMRWLLGDGSARDREYAKQVLIALKQTGARIPVTWGLEVANVVARYEARGLLEKVAGTTFFEKLRDLRIEVDHATFENALTRTLDMARKYQLSAYDASYLELAHRLDIPLATLDVSLSKAAKRAGVDAFSAQI